MSASASNSLTVKEGLVEIIPAERFQSKPRPGGNIEVVVMEKSGGTLRHHKTLRRPSDDLSVGEKLWGNYVCYIVKMDRRAMRFEEDFVTSDRITSVRIKVNATYQVVNSELAVIGFSDALQSMKDEMTSFLKKEASRSSYEHINEDALERKLTRYVSGFPAWIGIQVVAARIAVEVDKSVIDRLREDERRRRQAQIEDENRRRQAQIEDENRRRKHKLELEDIEHVDQILRKLGMNSLPADARLKLLAMSREKAFDEIGKYIADQRAIAQNFALERAKQEYDILMKMIDKGILEDFKLEDFGKTLLDRYSRVAAAQEILGAPPELLFGSAKRNLLEQGDKPSKRKRLKQEDEDDTEQE